MERVATPLSLPAGLANYVYIHMDDLMRQAMNTTAEPTDAHACL
jgi:hypothetical protein